MRQRFRAEVVGLAIGGTLGLGTGAMMGLLHMRGATVLGLHLSPGLAGFVVGVAAGLVVGMFLDFFSLVRISMSE